MVAVVLLYLLSGRPPALRGGRWRSPICSIPWPTGSSGSASAGSAATILILALFVLGARAALLIVVVPLAAKQVAAFAEQLPGYVSRLQALVAERGGPLIERIGGADAARTTCSARIGDLVGQGGSLGSHRSCARSGRAARR